MCWRSHRRSNAAGGIDRRAAPTPVGVSDRDKQQPGVVEELIEKRPYTKRLFRALRHAFTSLEMTVCAGSVTVSDVVTVRPSTVTSASGAY
jgi:hypothetical protein